MIQEDKYGKSRINDAPILLMGDDYELKSGVVGLHTDNAQETFFDNIQIKPMDCYKSTYDIDEAPEFFIETNRFKDIYKSAIYRIYD